MSPPADNPSDPKTPWRQDAPDRPSASGADGPPVQRRTWATRGLWAMTDQGLFAGSNFLIAVGLAAWLNERDFGAFTTAYASFLIIGVFTTALLTEPMMVYGAQKYRERLPEYLGRLVGLHFLIAVAGGLVMGGIGGLTWLLGDALLGLALCLLALTQCSQLLTWMLRSACYLESNPRHAALGGVIYLVLIVGALLTLQQLDRLSITLAILTMFGASLVVNLYLLRQLKVQLGGAFAGSGYRPVVADHWRYGKWASLTGLTRYIPEQLPYIAVPLILGLAAGGGGPDLETGGALKALMNFSVPLILIGWSASTLGTPMLVRAKHTPGFYKISALMLALAAGIPLVCWPLLGWLGEPIIALVYSGKYTQYAALTWLIGLIPVVAGIDAVLHTQLKAAERPDRLFSASLVASVVLVVVGPPLILAAGLTGAVWAILISYLTHTVTLVLFGGSIIRRVASPPTADPSGAMRPVELAPLPQQPLVSVVMANYNYGPLIGEAIQSVLDQTYRRFELIVVDDGSADDSVARARAFVEKDTRVTLITQDNRGQGGAWNTALELCRGDVLCLLDSDDVFEPDKLARVVETFAAEADAGIIQHPLRVIDPDNHKVQFIPFLSRLEEGWLGPTLLRRGGRWSTMPTSALSLRMEIAREFFPMDERRYRGSADALLFTGGPLRTPVRVIAEPLARYRIHGANLISSGSVNRAGVRKEIRSIHNTLRGTNEHFAGRGVAVPRLDARKHLRYLEFLFLLSMLRGQRRGWIGRYLVLSRAVIDDDMYGRMRKSATLAAYGLLPLMPRGWRSAWLNRTNRMGRAKGVVQAVLQLTRFKPRRAPDAGLSPPELQVKATA